MDSPPPRTLIADDQADVLDALRLLLKQEGFQVEAVNSPAAVLESLGRREYDVVLMDLNYARDTTSGEEGLDLVSRIHGVDNSLPVVVMTAWGTIPLAVEAMRRGVRDFVQKPWDNNQLLLTLRTQVAARREAQRHKLETPNGRDDLEEALAIQRGLLPQQLPRIPGYGLAVSWRPAEGVSGDYADVLRLDEHRIGLAIADVAGKGLPAALLMSNLQAAVRILAAEPLSTAELTTRANRIVCGNTPVGRFITFFYCMVDHRLKRLTYTNAGHCVPALVRTDGSAHRLDAGGPVLGVFPQFEYEQGSIQVQSGDKLVLFTDGIAEIENQEGEAFGEERLLELLISLRSLDAEALQQAIEKEVREFGADHFLDDATLLVLAVQ